jgi:3-oxoacyl-[acyl-carrier-protein] synthase II
MMGHSLGAAGAIEAVFSILAMRAGFLPPNINFSETDPACPLNIVANESRPAELRCVVSNSFGFGGTNASLVIESGADLQSAIASESRKTLAASRKQSPELAHLAGFAWVTPHGTDLASVWSRIQRGERAEPQLLRNPETGRMHRHLPVPMKCVEAVGRQPRLRRASAISHFAVAAGLAAIEHAGLKVTPEFAAGTALIFAIGDGGVFYTRRFYEGIVKQGANTASPLLFPETVHNAPASHLAAALGIDGPTYTLVGDATVGLAALKMAEQLLDLGGVERCVVVACEELDWILCEAYRDWRLAGSCGALLAEGAAALVLTRAAGRARIAVHDGIPFFRRSEAAAALDRVLADLGAHGPFDTVVSCRNGTFIDAAEASALAKYSPAARVLAPKLTLGESLGASALMQIVNAALAVETDGAQSVVVPVLGWNQQASGAVVLA